MILNVKEPAAGTLISTLELLLRAGFPVATSGKETFVAVRPVQAAPKTSWGEIIHLRHHPGRRLSVFADSIEEALQVLAYEFHLWEVKESFRAARRSQELERPPTIPK